MKKKIIFIFALLVMGATSLAPTMAFAETCGSLNSQRSSFFGLKSWYHYLECETEKDISAENFNSDRLAGSIWTIVLTVLSDLFFLAGLLAVILIAVSGFNFITSGGDVGKAQKAKKMLTGTIVGLVIVLLSQVIVNTILGMLNSGGGA
ncbi:hypothetical protein IKF81_01210 [Candidatus Saccharibacteria bacterium]|nr:hypothetical protein [Candidatus Saccharibacteria bacterium]